MSKVRIKVVIFCCWVSLFSSLPVMGFAPSPPPSPSPTVTKQNLTIARHITVSAAIEEATLTLNEIKLLLRKPIGRRERMAMADCSKLYETMAIPELKRALEPSRGTSPYQVGIWLTNASASLNNCEASISDQNITRPAFLDRHNASGLVSGSWAINAEIIKKMKGTGTAYH